LRQRLRVGVGDHELAPIKLLWSIMLLTALPPGATDTENGDPRLQVRLRCPACQIECHALSACSFDLCR
jgi:hypothetical protein